MPSLVLVTPPAAEPFDVAEAKLHLRVDGTDEDALIGSLIVVARRMAEMRTGRALLPQTWRLLLSSFPCDARPIPLPRPPFASVTSFTWVDAAGVTQTLAPPAYAVTQGGMLASLVPAFGTVWPVARSYPDSVAITFAAGYANAAAVPADLKAWMKIAVATLYDNRDAVLRGIDSVASFMPRGFVDALLDPYVVPVVA